MRKRKKRKEKRRRKIILFDYRRSIIDFMSRLERRVTMGITWSKGEKLKPIVNYRFFFFSREIETRCKSGII